MEERTIDLRTLAAEDGGHGWPYVPKCECHGEPMRWNRDPGLKAGGRWRCRVTEPAVPCPPGWHPARWAELVAAEPEDGVFCIPYPGYEPLPLPQRPSR